MTNARTGCRGREMEGDYRRAPDQRMFSAVQCRLVDLLAHRTVEKKM